MYVLIKAEAAVLEAAIHVIKAATKVFLNEAEVTDVRGYQLMGPVEVVGLVPNNSVGYRVEFCEATDAAIVAFILFT